MAEALLKHMCVGKYDVHSAGTNPTEVRPEAVEAMAELGLDISGYQSKSADEFRDKEIDYVITVCDNAKKSCPTFPAGTNRIHRAFEDPAAVTGDPETVLKAFKEVRNEINMYLAEFLRAIEPADPPEPEQAPPSEGA